MYDDQFPLFTRDQQLVLDKIRPMIPKWLPYYGSKLEQLILVERSPDRINVPLLRKTLEHIAANQQNWDQQWWYSIKDSTRYVTDEIDWFNPACKTTACLAGWVTILNGEEINYQTSRVAVGNALIPAPIHAAKLLGLSQHQADILFVYSTVIKDVTELIHLVEAVTGVELGIHVPIDS